MSRGVTTIGELSPEAATAELEAMTANFRKATPARDNLAIMLKDTWFLNGIEHGGAHGSSNGKALPGGLRFDEIQKAVADTHAEAGSPVDRAMAGHLDDINEGGQVARVKTVAALRADGIDDGAIRQLIANEPVSCEEHDRVARWKREAMENRQFCDAYLKGEPAAVRAMINANIVLTSPIKEAAAS